MIFDSARKAAEAKANHKSTIEDAFIKQALRVRRRSVRRLICVTPAEFMLATLRYVKCMGAGWMPRYDFVKHTS